MSREARSGDLHGLWGFPLTPFDDRGAVDLGALERSVAVQLGGELDVIVALGAIAEVDALSPSEWRAVLADIVGCVAERVPLLVMLPSDPDEAVRAAEHARAAGVWGLVVTQPEHAGFAQVLSSLSRLTERSERLPLVLYQRTPLPLEIGEIDTLIADTSLVGVKDGTGDLRRFRRLHETHGRALTFAAAWEDMAAAYGAVGADAFCPASAAHDPRYTRAWYDALHGGDVCRARRLLEAFAYPFTDLRLSRPGVSVSVVKEAMRLRGLEMGGVRPPGGPLTTDEVGQVAVLLEGLDRAIAA